jgi:hypothetical protein
MSHLSVQTKLETVSSKPHYHVQRQVQLLSLLLMNKCIVFLHSLNKISTVIVLSYLFSSALLTSLNIPFLCVPRFHFVL